MVCSEFFVSVRGTFGEYCEFIKTIFRESLSRHEGTFDSIVLHSSTLWKLELYAGKVVTSFVIYKAFSLVMQCTKERFLQNYYY